MAVLKKHKGCHGDKQAINTHRQAPGWVRGHARNRENFARNTTRIDFSIWLQSESYHRGVFRGVFLANHLGKN